MSLSTDLIVIPGNKNPVTRVEFYLEQQTESDHSSALLLATPRHKAHQAEAGGQHGVNLGFWNWSGGCVCSATLITQRYTLNLQTERRNTEERFDLGSSKGC